MTTAVAATEEVAVEERWFNFEEAHGWSWRWG